MTRRIQACHGELFSAAIPIGGWLPEPLWLVTDAKARRYRSSRFMATPTWPSAMSRPSSRSTTCVMLDAEGGIENTDTSSGKIGTRLFDEAR